jgi:glycosyltransferase involved in cell wall biosynthesis
MKINIAHIIPGSGGSFYCGNCLRDSKFFDAMRADGHNAIKIPMYLPLFAHDANNGMTPVFYGAISIYLKQVFPVFRHAPEWFDNLLNSRPMLKFAAKMANSTRAKGLEEMTISMLMGEHGNQNHELEKMVHWLKDHFKPDVIHISNALLLGLAHRLKEHLNVPVICSLQDEDVWVDNMKPEFIDNVWNLMQEKANDIDMFVSVSHYYSEFMRNKLHISEDKLTTLHLGVDPDDYNYINAAQKPLNIGFLSRLCHENGLDILIDAFILLKSNPAFCQIKLLLTGGYTSDDQHFLKVQKEKLKQAGLYGFVEFIEDFSQQNRHNFLDNVSVLSVPVRQGEAFGIYLTEAMAAGIPIVQPALGAFPEIIEKSGGGLVYANNTPEELCAALESILIDNQKIGSLSEKARNSVVEEFNIHKLTEKMMDVYQKAINSNGHGKAETNVPQ